MKKYNKISPTEDVIHKAVDNQGPSYILQM